MQVGQLVSIRLGGGVAHSCVVVEMTHATVCTVREKAVELDFTPPGGDRRRHPARCWFPIKALRPFTLPLSGDTAYKLAHWFYPDHWQESCMERGAHISGVSARQD